MLLLLTLLACELSSPSPTHPLARPVDGWGAVLWHGGAAVKYGGGSHVVSPQARAGAVTATDAAPDRCGGVVLADAPAAAALAPPDGGPLPELKRPPAVPAATVEAALWRVDTLLPPADAFTPIDPRSTPAQARGVELGSVVKTRRSGAPPVLVVSGTRACTATLAILDAKATRVLSSISVPEVCDTPRVFPPTDLDGDGALETALFTDARVVAARLALTSGDEGITLLGDWACPSTPQ